MIGHITAEIERFWRRAKQRYGIQEEMGFVGTFADPRFAPYHDELLELVAQGLKRATAHLALDFDRNGIRLRRPGDYWIVLDTKNRPRYLIQIRNVETKPFNAVELDFAAREGEGDRSLAYWQRVHRDYFQKQCADWQVEWREDLPTVCEVFDVIEAI